MMDTPTLLLLDIDGVFSINSFDPLPGVIRHQPDRNVFHPPAYPVPNAWSLLQWIEAQSHLHPRWLSSWGILSHRWNQWSGTSAWKVIYPSDHYGLHEREWQGLKQLRRTLEAEIAPTWEPWKQIAIYQWIAALHPDALEPQRSLIEALRHESVFQGVDTETAKATKLMAVMMEIKALQWEGRVVWVEDGGWNALEIEWAAKNNIILFDTWQRSPAGLWQGLDEELVNLLELA